MQRVFLQIKIFGGKRRPLIEGTKLSLMSLDPEDAGVYTCKLALKDTIPNPKYILSMSVQVTVLPSPDNSTWEKITQRYTADSPELLDQEFLKGPRGIYGGPQTEAFF